MSEQETAAIQQDTVLEVAYTCQNGHEPAVIHTLAGGALLLAFEHGRNCPTCETANVDSTATVGRVETFDGQVLEFERSEGNFLEVPEVPDSE